MKKSLVTALTTALVVGAASTTFAAANPFSDVPSGHWAYDAVTQLAADGIVEGYGDGTYLGEKNITRYEMAQMVAKAMARKDVPMNDKNLIDRLAAEFSDELNTLGVRVANLEKNSDKVKWTGKMEYTYWADREKEAGNTDKWSDNEAHFRLEPVAEVNSNWHVKARLDAKLDMDRDSVDGDERDRHDQDNTVKLSRVYAQGDYDKFTVKFGKFASYNDDNIFDADYSGAEVRFGNVAKVTIGAGRLSGLSDSMIDDVATNYQYIGVDAEKGNLSAGVAYHHLNDSRIGGARYSNNANEDEANIWVLKGAYQFNRNVGINAMYAQNSTADNQKKAGNVELTYKGAESENKGSWGAWLAYRHLGENVAAAPTYDIFGRNEKGWELGTNYTVFPNVVTTLRYGVGEKIDNTNRDVKEFFGRVTFMF